MEEINNNIGLIYKNDFSDLDISFYLSDLSAIDIDRYNFAIE